MGSVFMLFLHTTGSKNVLKKKKKAAGERTKERIERAKGID